jgi:CheY-like chemotaxis protein
MQIMMVDDDRAMLDMYGIALERNGLRVFKVWDSAEAVQKLEDLVPDLFILDVMMPGITGIELCRLIRAMPHLNEKPILMLSANLDPKMIDECLQAGASDYAQKPIQLKDLISTIRRLAAPNSPATTH